MIKMSDNNTHKDHRIRLKARFKAEGLSGFQDHNILELLLFYAIPRKDTNELAHKLIEKFGSLSAVFDADYNQLINTDGIGENTATLIKLIPSLARAYLMDKETRYPNFSDLHKLGSYLVNYFIGMTKENLIAVYLNNRVEMIDIVTISEGIVNSTAASPRKVIEAALHRNAAYIVLAHNHPDGDSRPSEEDLALTKAFSDICNMMEMPLVEHIVVGGNNYTGIITHESSGIKYADLTPKPYDP